MNLKDVKKLQAIESSSGDESSLSELKEKCKQVPEVISTSSVELDATLPVEQSDEDVPPSNGHGKLLPDSDSVMDKDLDSFKQSPKSGASGGQESSQSSETSSGDSSDSDKGKRKKMKKYQELAKILMKMKKIKKKKGKHGKKRKLSSSSSDSSSESSDDSTEKDVKKSKKIVKRNLEVFPHPNFLYSENDPDVSSSS